MQTNRTSLISLCTKYGPLINVPETINGAQLLWSISGNESSFGINCEPRHELGYCYGHRYFEPSSWGCLAHCSYGPWQVMYTHAKQFTPLQLLIDPDKCAQVAIAFLNSEIFGRQKAQTLEQVADAYNSGNFRDNNVPLLYITKLNHNYTMPMQ